MINSGKVAGLFGNIILFCMFIIIIFMCTLILMSSFNNFINTNKEIEKTVTQTAEHIKSVQSISDSTKTDLFFSTNIDKLKSTIDKSINSNTISFLFTIFSIALVSAGVYLLSRSNSNLLESEEKLATTTEKAELIGPFVTNGLTSFTIASYLSISYQLTWLLKTSTFNQKKISFIPLIRDSLNILKNMLCQAANNNVGFDSTQLDFFLDYATGVLTNLEEFSKDINEQIEDIIKICNECIFILQNSSFDQLYEEQVHRLNL